MKAKLISVILLMTILTTAAAQQNTAWDNWAWLMGEWKGEGSGTPGKGGGTFSFAPDLDKKILMKKGHSEYPADEGKPKTVHDDMLIVYPDYTGKPVKAIYFDNEGHTINYSITYSDKTIILISDKLPHVPVFRLTYILVDKETVNTKFEMSLDGEKFTTYIEGDSKKLK